MKNLLEFGKPLSRNQLKIISGANFLSPGGGGFGDSCGTGDCGPGFVCNVYSATCIHDGIGGGGSRGGGICPENFGQNCNSEY